MDFPTFICMFVQHFWYHGSQNWWRKQISIPCSCFCKICPPEILRKRKLIWWLPKHIVSATYSPMLQVICKVAEVHPIVIRLSEEKKITTSGDTKKNIPYYIVWFEYQIRANKKISAKNHHTKNLPNCRYIMGGNCLVLVKLHLSALKWYYDQNLKSLL